MAKSSAVTVEAYLQELPAERRAVIEQVRQVILDNLPPGYEESMNWGMISYEVPLERYPKTYNKQPLNYAGLAAQKNNYSLYLMCAYNGSMQEGWLKEQFANQNLSQFAAALDDGMPFGEFLSQVEREDIS